MTMNDALDSCESNAGARKLGFSMQALEYSE
jgi:hypothetical protein